MSIQSEINRISGNVANALTAIANKGVTVPQGSNSDDLATLIGQIQQGGGAGAISIVDTPDSAGGTVRTITAVDISSDTVTAAHLESGYTAHDAAGNAITGTLSPSTTPAPQKQINFIDFDGTILYSYTAQEANALTALPANPTHAGLTAQGWNWSLAQIKAQLTAMPDGPVWVGQMYITQSGDTEIDVRFADAARLSPILTVAVNGTITVDWGDNTTADTVTGSSLTTRQEPSHTYAAPGEYTIKIHAVSGSFTFYGSSSYLLLRKSTNANENRAYANCVQAIRLGSGITSIGNYALYYCTSLAYITLPNTVTSIGTSAFNYCLHLASITVPSDFTSLTAVFGQCYSLVSASIPSSITTIGYNLFINCHHLASITIPSGVTSIGSNVFSSCECLMSLILPSGLTNLDTGVINGCISLTSFTIPNSVTSIGVTVFNGCSSLISITIPSDVTSIGTGAFQSCYGMAEYHILPTTPPTLSTNVFTSIPSDCVIYVPSAKLTDYQAAENWSAYASYMQGE